MRLWDHVDAVLDSTDKAPGVEAFVDALDRQSAYSELYEALEKAQAFIAHEFKVRHDSYFALLLGVSRLPTPTDDQVKDVKEASEMLVAVSLALAHARGEK
jgi:hypothetical protein